MSNLIIWTCNISSELRLCWILSRDEVVKICSAHLEWGGCFLRVWPGAFRCSLKRASVVTDTGEGRDPSLLCGIAIKRFRKHNFCYSRLLVITNPGASVLPCQRQNLIWISNLVLRLLQRCRSRWSQNRFFKKINCWYAWSHHQCVNGTMAVKHFEPSRKLESSN